MPFSVDDLSTWLHFCFVPLFNASPHHARFLRMNSLDKERLYSHMNSIGHYADFVPGSCQGKVCLMSCLNDLAFVFSQTAPLVMDIMPNCSLLISLVGCLFCHNRVTTRKLGTMEWIGHFPTSFSNLNAAFLFELTRCFPLWGRNLHWCFIKFSAELSVKEERVQPADLQASEGDAFICCFHWLLPPGFGQFILCPHSSDLHYSIGIVLTPLSLSVFNAVLYTDKKQKYHNIILKLRERIYNWSMVRVKALRKRVRASLQWCLCPQ